MRIDCPTLVVAKTYTEDGELRAECPECGHLTTFGDSSKVIAYVWIDVED
jgi:hypothetical protein